MVLTDEVIWGPGDFLIAWILLAGAGIAYKLISGRMGHTTYKYAVGIAVFTALLLVWMNLAVGLIGSEDNPANLLYAGVLVVGFTGVMLSQFKPRGMSRALFLTALAQALVPFIAMLIWKPPMSNVEESLGVLGVIVLNMVFAALWYASARLFRKVAREQTLPNVAL
ncbi:MAG: hypothetical protein K9N34_03260 [Candidatus Marinimicrobia bacterium]|nr:hypothetical protein [Candidatus Neomarinimicrobiota bacterium]MCF7839695.1 hypothetical protein [Candidatus Neomarinimicrobiota bacterium]MCF7901923.1 hypothetical protein [Candidatus Neomarinimicrobiota bacterium]